MKFKVIKEDRKTKARVGRITLFHGKIETPAFVPVGTQASVKALSPRDLEEIGVQVFFANTYHLYLRPEAKVIASLGGLHQFMNWKGPIMTDSGGFQIFSLGLGRYKLKVKSEKLKVVQILETLKGVAGEKLAEITEEGVRFKSHLDGSEHLLSPERSIAIQRLLGADIMMAFDDCTPHPVSYEFAQDSMEKTHRWAVRSLQAHQKVKDSKQNLFGVVQGSIYRELREKSAQFIDALNTPGIAIGGVSVGESKREMYQVLDWIYPFISPNKPRHLLGVGEIDDIFAAVERGIDSLDCVIPTRWARNGTLIVHPTTSKKERSKSSFRLIIQNAKYVEDKKAIDPDCECYVCQNFTRAYLNHLYRTKEILGTHLGTYHNVYFLTELMRSIREAILEDRFLELKEKWIG